MDAFDRFLDYRNQPATGDPMISVSKPIISVVIPTCERNDLLAKCLERLAPRKQTLSPEHYEIIVTDDGSQLNARELIKSRHPWASWVQGPQRGPAANRNRGASVARGKWLAFTDDDCLPDAGWLAAYTDGIETHSNTEIFEGRVYVDRPRRSLAETSPVNDTGGFLWSCNFAIRNDLFQKMKGFDERFLYAAMEDVELGTRLKQRGHGFVFLDRAAVCHPWRIAGGWKQFKNHQEATLCYLQIHPEEGRRINSAFYLKATLRSLIHETIPGMARMGCAGLGCAALGHLANIEMALRLYARSIGMSRSPAGSRR